LKGLSVIITVIVAIIFVCGLFACQKKGVTKTVVLLCDLSESTKHVRNFYLDSFKTVLSSISHGDVLVMAKITEASITEPSIPIKKEFPPFVAKDKMGNPTDNPVIVRRLKEEADKNLEETKSELLKIATTLVRGSEPPIGDRPEVKEPSKRILRTDIFSSLHVAAGLFKEYKRDKSILVVLSDMIEESSDYDFKKEHLTERRIEAIIRKEKAADRLPDLRGVKVYVVCAGVTTKDMFFALQRFWLRYFKECGADLKKERYASALAAFNE